ncbi:MAG: deoxynucleoside kinase [Bacteroidetes bacterium]|nr:deoxynucleoside kinase [Bacteroidota bacterium]
MRNKKKFIAIAGNIGSGKSSLTTSLATDFKWKPYFESVEDNPYLSDFYGDMQKWSFHLQIYFLSKRFQSHKNIIESKESVIQDRTIYEDAEIFAKNLFDSGKMLKREYDNYVSLFNTMVPYLRPPNLLIYLRANVKTLVKQISLRGRDYEKTIPEKYLKELNKLYENWVKSYKHGDLLVIESDKLDFVNNKKDFLKIKSLVAKKLNIKI